MTPRTQYQLSGIFMVISGLSTGLMSALIGLALLLFGVGLVWLFPFIVAIRSIIYGVMAMAGTRNEGAPMASIIALVMSILALNPVGFCCEAIAIVLMMTGGVPDFLEGKTQDAWGEDLPPRHATAAG